MPDDAKAAVFVSYAHEDAAAAQRIAEALRSHGVEVWFDQNELRGGDAWDQKIRRQINECTLFLPVISQHTEERSKGYFRLEWKLAVEQTYLMMEGVPFLVPVVVDATPDASAAVPAEFRRVQWTRLPGALPTPQFVERISRLLAAPHSAAPAAKVGQVSDLPHRETLTHSATAKRLPGWTWAAIGLGVAIIAVAAFLVLRPTTRETVASRPNSKPQTPSAQPLDFAPAKSIAVLPFENFSPDKDNAFFADGMHDEVITALAKIHDLTVISRMSVMAYRKSEGRNLKEIAAELGVASVLEGSVQRAGSKVKVIVQLIDARSDKHLWAETYTEDVTDVFTIQSKLAGAITSALKATLSPEEKSLLARRPTQNQEAYDLYLRARAMSETSDGVASREILDRVVALYEQAIARDPAFTLAHVQLSLTHCLLYWFGYLDPTPARRARAKDARDAALRLAPDAPETRLALGYYSYACDNDWARALTEFRAAETGLPNDAQVTYYIGLSQRRLGRLTETLASFARAVELNPRGVASPVEQLLTLNAVRRYAETRDLGTRYLTLFPNNTRLLSYSTAARLELERDRAAYFRSREAIPLASNDPQGLFRLYSLARARGDLVAAERALADLRLAFVPGFENIANEPVALHRATVAFLRGQRDAARAFAEEATADYRARQWTLRQEPSVILGTALAHALAGKADEAVRLAREGFALQIARDVFASFLQRPYLAQVYLVLDRRDEAFAVLREMMTEPCSIGPEQVRLDPFWSRLKDDPRFEEILKSARPL